MTDHLPECYWPDTPERAICICDRLRACEERVYQEQIAGRQRDMVSAYLRGLDAAEAAVAEMVIETVGQALAAIDALREEQK